MKEKEFAGKRVLITGGGSGIGKATAEAFLYVGAAVVVFDCDAPPLERLQAEHPGRPLTTTTVDISDEGAVAAAFRQLPDPFDVLINNAAREINFHVEEPNFADWDAVMDTNVKGALFVTSHVIHGMHQRGSGSIIFITSVHSAQAFAGEAAYDASKHALVGLMRVLAVEQGRYGIRVNAVAPGAIYPTGLSRHLTPEVVERIGKLTPIGRVGRPDEIATVCLFLASAAASYITGAEVRVDGGRSIMNPIQVAADR